ncbi:conserved Plasmodium protein, unknown function [Plasmodium knowlesi strain H]|uniref:Uncharacterized protein n=3 Tax=Plasmodium knowlesi TaxID=5850 RepID=A0A5K1VM51_PLAKH|nr:conserved Plasmodium protein, unknown function [Plasmodium knowlesi strain H]OTN66856.1 Uncharacterized protein PKNOH_S08493800 [Plasmodium knowlesi]CAA9986793.1 conserved Plasmodium protein, unknown function [Plasmodium knowlesi strain H]SBO23636.1 conserved Plasmodium protein, unknown function [Plasmodium knowlesi strain H]SBO25211.1 conserved Plasmodium protein, unknown function [Plasmodium knowlesi strain H]VVS76267.1 conserved Plasmodium protein, unknown function [Plasmodium knowlesi s|eukprot:XP_002257977.1 hypothetical protein, conserved in Plasmodium species [Plasmodium knowlesi strain H]
MGFVKAEEFVNHYMRVNREIKELSSRKNEEFKFNIFIFYYNDIDSICTEHILHFHKNVKRDINIFSYGIEKKEDLLNFCKKYEDVYSKNMNYYRDYFYEVIMIGMCSHMNTDGDVYTLVENFFTNIMNKNYVGYLKFFVIDNRRPYHEIFETSDKWDLVLTEGEMMDVMAIYSSAVGGKGNATGEDETDKGATDKGATDKGAADKESNDPMKGGKGKKNAQQKLQNYYNTVKEENKCMCLMIYPFIQCVGEDDSSAIIFISSVSLISYLKTDAITYDYYNKEIKNLHNDSMNISNGHFISFDRERGLLPMLSFMSLNESLEIDERIYIYDHKNVKNTFNKIRTMCHIEIKEFTGNFRQLDLKKQNEILIKLKAFIKIIKPMNSLAWKRRTYVLYNSDSFYFMIVLIYIYINRIKKMDSYLYNCLKTSDFLYNIFKDRLKQSEIYDKLIEKHLHKNAASYLSVLIKKIMESNKKTINITSKLKIFMDIFQTAKNSYTHPFELKFLSNMFSSFQSYCNDKYKTYHLVVCHINDSDDTLLYGFTPLNKKDYWPSVFSKIAYSNSEQITYDTVADVNTLRIRKNDFKFILSEIKDVFRGVLRYQERREMDESDSTEAEMEQQEEEEEAEEEEEEEEEEDVVDAVEENDEVQEEEEATEEVYAEDATDGADETAQ